MKGIGFRSTASEVHYAVAEGTPAEPALLTVDVLRAPRAYEFPQALAWYREQCIALIREFEVHACGVRLPEPLAGRMGSAARQGAQKRANIEGVLMEACACMGLGCVVGPLATIAARLGERSVTTILEATSFRGVKRWSTLNYNKKEAVLVAIAALSAREA